MLRATWKDSKILGNITFTGKRPFTGHKAGESAREGLRLDHQDTLESPVKVVVEDGVIIQKNYLQALFGKSLEELGASGFDAKYGCLDLVDTDTKLPDEPELTFITSDELAPETDSAPKKRKKRTKKVD